MKLPTTNSLANGFPLVIPTRTQQPTARLLLRNVQGQVVQQWLVKQNKCTLGNAASCSLRCQLPGIAPYHALLVIGARQIFIRGLAPKLSRDGQPFSELLLTDEDSHFELAGHRFELTRNSTEVQTATRIEGSTPERIKFTLARPFELRNRPQSAKLPYANEVANEPSPETNAELLQGNDSKWVAKLIQAAMQPLECQLHNLLEPLTELQSESRKQRRLRKKRALRKRNSPESQPSVASDESLQIAPPQFAQQVEEIVVKHAAAMEVLTERISDVNLQLSVIERIVAEERTQSQERMQRQEEIPAPTEDPQLALQSAAIEQLQHGIVSVTSALERLQSQQIEARDDDQNWKASVQTRLEAISNVIDDLSASVDRVHNIALRGGAHPLLVESTPMPATSEAWPVVSQPPELQPVVDEMPYLANGHEPESEFDGWANTQAELPLATEYFESPDISPQQEAFHFAPDSRSFGPIDEFSQLQATEQEFAANAHAANAIETTPVPIPVPFAEPPVDSVAAPSAEPTVIPVAEVIVEDIAEPIVEDFAESIVEALAESFVEDIAEPIVEALAESGVVPMDQAIVEPDSDSSANLLVKPVSDSTAEPAAESIAETMVEPIAESQVDLAAETMIEPTAGHVVDSFAKPVSDATAEVESQAGESALPSWWVDDEPNVAPTAASDSPPTDNRIDELSGEHSNLPNLLDTGLATGEHEAVVQATIETSSSNDEPSEEFFGLAQLAIEEHLREAEPLATSLSPHEPVEHIDPPLAEVETDEEDELIGFGHSFSTHSGSLSGPIEESAVASKLSQVEPTHEEEAGAHSVDEVEQPEEAYTEAYESPHASRGIHKAEPKDAFSTTSGDEEEDDSVEEYMRKLLARMRGVPEEEVEIPKVAAAAVQSTVAPATPTKQQAAAATRASMDRPMPQHEMADESTRGTTSYSPSRGSVSEVVTEPFDPEKYMPRATAPERSKSLAAMRELANSSARTAIHKSTRQRHVSSILLKAAIAIVGLVVGSVLIAINGFNLNIGLVATIASFLVAAIWGYDSISSIRPMLQNGLVLKPQETSSRNSLRGSEAKAEEE